MWTLVGERINFGVVPPPSMYYANNDGYSSEMLSEDMFRKGTIDRMTSGKGSFPPDLHYYKRHKNNPLYKALKVSNKTDEDMENSNQNTAHGR